MFPQHLAHNLAPLQNKIEKKNVIERLKISSIHTKTLQFYIDPHNVYTTSMLCDHKRLPQIPTQKDCKENEAPFKVLIYLPKNWGWISKTGVGFFFFLGGVGHRPGGHMLNHFRLPCPANCCIPLHRDRRSHRSCCVNVCTLQSLSLSLCVHSTTCHKLGVVVGHEKPEDQTEEYAFLLRSTSCWI